MGYIICLIGPSGSGKSTIAEKLQSMYEFIPIQIHTNRPMRQNEAPNKNYVIHEPFTLPWDLTFKPYNIVWDYHTEFIYQNNKNEVCYWHELNKNVFQTDDIYIMESINPSMLKYMHNIYGNVITVPIILDRDMDSLYESLMLREIQSNTQNANREEMYRRIQADMLDFSHDRLMETCKDYFLDEYHVVSVSDNFEDTEKALINKLRWALRIDKRSYNKKYIELLFK